MPPRKKAAPKSAPVVPVDTDPVVDKQESFEELDANGDVQTSQSTKKITAKKYV